MFGIASNCIIFFCASHYCLCNYTERLEELKIIPDIIPVPPSQLCRFAYYIGKSWKEIKSGESLLYTDLKYRPKLKWPASEDTYYTLYMTGISFVDRKRFQQEFEELANIEITEPILTRHKECWTVINIPGNNIKLGEELFAYKPVLIDMFNVTEYLIFLVYNQTRKYHRMEPKERYPRSPSVKELTQKYRLGNAWAGNFFIVNT